MATGISRFQKTIDASISSGLFEDTKIILYSRKDAYGNVYGPKALYANSDLLKTVEYFDESEPCSSSSQRANRLIPSK